MAHPVEAMTRLMAFAERRGFFNTAVTIEEGVPTQSDSGQLTQSWDALADHAGISARVAPAPASNEIRSADGTIAIDARIITLRGCFPAITTKHRAVDGDTAWNILAVQHGGQRAHTKLIVEEFG